MASAAQQKANKRYKQNIKRFTVDFTPAEADLWEQVSKQPNKQGYIKRLIRADMEKLGVTPEKQMEVFTMTTEKTKADNPMAQNIHVAKRFQLACPSCGALFSCSDPVVDSRGFVTSPVCPRCNDSNVDFEEARGFLRLTHDRDGNTVPAIGFDELRSNALANCTLESLGALAEFCGMFADCWVSDHWDIGEGYAIAPLYRANENDEFPEIFGRREIIGYELRYPVGTASAGHQRCLGIKKAGGTPTTDVATEDFTMRNIGRYDYAELRAAALETRSAQDLFALGEWCSRYGNCWNGECYDIDDGYGLYPIFSAPDEYGDSVLLGYEIR